MSFLFCLRQLVALVSALMLARNNASLGLFWVFNQSRNCDDIGANQQATRTHPEMFFDFRFIIIIVCLRLLTNFDCLSYSFSSIA